MPNIKVNPTIIILILSFSNFFVACSAKFAEYARVGVSEYEVRQGDVLEIEFDYYPDFNQTVIVGPNGKTSFRALEELQVQDLTIGELRQNLTKEYGRMLAEPKLRIRVHESSKFSIYVGGHIKKPGMVKFKRGLTIVEGILLAGGLKDKSKRSYEIFVFRNRADKGVKMYKFAIGKKIDVKQAKRNFKLAPYDVVFVMASETSQKKNKKLI